MTDSTSWSIAQYYDRQPEREWERLERHRTEFALTLRTLADHLPSPPARVLDCGGGPGRYAIELARRGYDVVLFDISTGNLRLAREKAVEAGVTLAAFEEGTATDLSRFPDGVFDAVLLMGPLYHLLREEERELALAEAHRVLTPGGALFAAFLSRYAVLRWAAAHEPAWPVENPQPLETLLTTGVLLPRGRDDLEFVAHFAHPTDVVPLLRDEGFEVMTVLAAEGLVSMIEDAVNDLSGPAWDAWVDLNYRVANDSSIQGCVEHLLAVAVKPRWRAVLCRIGRRLSEVEMAWKVVGGASVALHGVDVPVNDVDIETTAEHACRFEELFADRVVDRVALRESAVYRSHFGRFDFDGVMVEVMGDLHRRDGEAWVPTATKTEITVDLDGVPVCISWLEEETLAYIRRGRLDRAARCLRHCDRGRLVSLLRRELATDVL